MLTKRESAILRVACAFGIKSFAYETAQTWPLVHEQTLLAGMCFSAPPERAILDRIARVCSDARVMGEDYFQFMRDILTPETYNLLVSEEAIVSRLAKRV